MRSVRFAGLALAWTMSCAPAPRATSARAPTAPASAAPSARPPASAVAPGAKLAAPKKNSTPAVPPSGCALVAPKVFSAMLLRGGKLIRTEWHLEPNGAIEVFPSDLDYDAPHAKTGRRVVLKSAQSPAVSSESARIVPPGIRSVPGARFHLSGAPRRCSLTLPGEAPRIVEMQWYNGSYGLYERFAVLSPERPAGWMLVLANVMFSPRGGWLAPALGDLDGDGRPDLAFVAEGLGCDGKLPVDCPELWVNAFMSATDTSSLPTLVNGATYHRLVVEIGLPPDKLLGEADVEKPRFWRGRIRRGAYEISVSGPKRVHKWTAALRDGRLTLEGALHGP